MSDDSFKYYTNNDCGMMVQVDVVTFNALSQVAACAILDFCENNPPDHKHKPARGVMFQLKAHAADHYWINVMLANVKLVHSYMQAHLENPDRMISMFASRDSIYMLTRAMTAFQDWKTSYNLSEQGEYGQHWGTQTGFYLAKWDDLNEAFLSQMLK
jgi:hypothetical protein